MSDDEGTRELWLCMANVAGGIVGELAANWLLAALCFGVAAALLSRVPARRSP